MSSWCTQSPKQIFGGIYSNDTSQQESNSDCNMLGTRKLGKFFYNNSQPLLSNDILRHTYFESI